MLFLQFSVGKERYALPASQVVEVIPAVHLKAIPATPEYVAGVMNYRDYPVPVLDLCALTVGRTCRKWFSTRIILVKYPWPPGTEEAIVGLMAEQTTELVQSDLSSFKPSGVYPEDAPFLGGVKGDRDGMVQQIEVKHLLPDHVREIIFREEIEQGHETAPG